MARPSANPASKLPPVDPNQGPNALADQTAYGAGNTLVPQNPSKQRGPQRGGTTVTQGQVGIAPGGGRARGSNN